MSGDTPSKKEQLLKLLDRGSVFVRDPLAETSDCMEMPLRALGMVWISDAGGWSELPA